METPNEAPAAAAAERRARRQQSQLRAAVSLLLERQRFAATAGMTFPDGAGGFLRDMYAQLGYKRDLAPRDYWDRYLRGGVSRRIIDAYPRATWIGGVELREDPDPGVSTPFETALSRLDRRLDLWARVMRADVLAGLGRYAVLVIGARGNLASQLPRLSSADEILYLTPLSEQRAKITKFVLDQRDPRFGLPEEYGIQLVAEQETKVHWTRVVHVAENLLEDDVYGRPRLEPVWNYLDDLEKIVGGGAEASWKRMDPGMQLDIDPTVELTETDEQDLSDEIDEYVHGLRRVMRTRGADLKLLNALPSPFGTNIEAILQLIGAATGIPQRILAGSERGELASQQDRENWNDRVAERRREFAEPLVKRLIERLVDAGALPAPNEETGYEIHWPEAEELSEAEKAGVASTMASANASQKASEGSVIMTATEIRDRILGLGPLEVEEATGEEFAPEESEELPEDGSPFGEDDADEQGAGDDAADAAEEPGAIDQEKPVRRAAAAAATAEPPTAGEREALAVLAAGDRAAANIAGALWTMWRAAAADLNAIALGRSAEWLNRTAIEREVYEAVNRAINSASTTVTGSIAATAVAGGRAAAASVRRRGGFTTAAAAAAAAGGGGDYGLAKLDERSPRLSMMAAAAWAALVARFGREALISIRGLLQRLFTARPPVAPQRVVSMVRSVIGLRPDQVESVLALAESGATTAAVERYARRLLRQRVKLIARTEAARAAAAGQRELWLQAQERGLLPHDQKRIWLATLDDRVRDAHLRMHGQLRGLQEPFTRPDGKRIEPGEEPNCRCGQALDFSEATTP